MDNRQQFAYYTQHPPKNLAEFAAQPTSLAQVVFDGHGYFGLYPHGLRECLNIIFKISCKCGSELHTLIVQSRETEIYHNNDLLIGEFYSLRCISCGKQTLLFDPIAHGYNAEIAVMDGYASELVRLTTSDSPVSSENYKCLSCGEGEVAIFARFEYSANRIEDPEFADRPQDFFSWLTVVTECPKCSKLSTVVDYECA